MTEKEFESKIMELSEDKAFVEELTSKSSPEDVQSFLASKGVPCTVDDVKRLGKVLKEHIGSKELSADDLDSVSGGGFIDMLRSATSSLASSFWDWIND